MEYIPFHNTDTGKWFALFPLGESVGPYDSLDELEIDMEKIRRHIAAGSFGGAR